MLIKSADDKQPQIEALTALLAGADLDPATSRRIETEIRQMRAGLAGERDAAYEIEFHLGPKPNWMTIHDLRLEVDGRVAQIDHLIIDRLVNIWVCESKHFSEGVAVDDFGEWVGFYGRRPFGIGSPIEQNRKHIAVLNDAFAKGLIAAPKRLGFTVKPDLRSLVLVSKGARISRPKTEAGRARVEGLDQVIKVDQLIQALNAAAETRGLRGAPRVVGKETIERLARGLVGLHSRASVDWARRFGLPTKTPVAAPPAAHQRIVDSVATRCESCGKAVSDRVAQYCRSQAARFGGRILCYDCQRRAPARST